jgi:hypothetical protein
VRPALRETALHCWGIFGLPQLGVDHELLAPGHPGVAQGRLCRQAEVAHRPCPRFSTHWENRGWAPESLLAQFFTIDISVSVLRAPVFIFIQGLCKVMFTPLSLSSAPFAPVWMTAMPGSLV